MIYASIIFYSMFIILGLSIVTFMWNLIPQSWVLFVTTVAFGTYAYMVDVWTDFETLIVEVGLLTFLGERVADLYGIGAFLVVVGMIGVIISAARTFVITLDKQKPTFVA